MNKNTYDIYFDLGSSKIRATAFDKQEKNQIFFLEKNCLTCLKSNQLNLLETDRIIEETVFEIEKKTGEYLTPSEYLVKQDKAPLYKAFQLFQKCHFLPV